MVLLDGPREPVGPSDRVEVEVEASPVERPVPGGGEEHAASNATAAAGKPASTTLRSRCEIPMTKASPWQATISTCGAF